MQFYDKMIHNTLKYLTGDYCTQAHSAVVLATYEVSP